MLKERETLIDSHDPSVESRMGSVIQCECGSEVFHLFIIKGHDHPHIQCARCGDVFCPRGGSCDRESKEDA